MSVRLVREDGQFLHEVLMHGREAAVAYTEWSRSQSEARSLLRRATMTLVTYNLDDALFVRFVEDTYAAIQAAKIPPQSPGNCGHLPGESDGEVEDTVEGGHADAVGQ
jgi:hypothetical protein